MQGTVTATSIIAVADGITKAGLWGRILDALLPSSFWGWVFTIAKLAFNIALAVVSAPAWWVVKGGKLLILVADVLMILGGGAAAEAALILAHADRLRGTSRKAETDLAPA